MAYDLSSIIQVGIKRDFNHVIDMQRSRWSRSRAAARAVYECLQNVPGDAKCAAIRKDLTKSFLPIGARAIADALTDDQTTVTARGSVQSSDDDQQAYTRDSYSVTAGPNQYECILTASSYGDLLRQVSIHCPQGVDADSATRGGAIMKALTAAVGGAGSPAAHWVEKQVLTDAVADVKKKGSIVKKNGVFGAIRAVAEIGATSWSLQLDHL